MPRRKLPMCEKPQKPPKRPIDYAARDPRSVAAQLRGNGDGAEKDWLAFRDRIRAQRPDLDDAEISEIYAARCMALTGQNPPADHK